MFPQPRIGRSTEALMSCNCEYAKSIISIDFYQPFHSSKLHDTQIPKGEKGCIGTCQICVQCNTQHTSNQRFPLHENRRSSDIILRINGTRRASAQHDTASSFQVNGDHSWRIGKLQCLRQRELVTTEPRPRRKGIFGSAVEVDVGLSYMLETARH